MKISKKGWVIFVILIVVTLSVTQICGDLTVDNHQSTTWDNSEKKILWKSQGATTWEEHDPIVITSDSSFANQAQIEGWQGNGSRTNPYIIENYTITGEGDLIRIEYVSVFFSTRNCILQGGRHGIFMKSVENGNIKKMTIFNNTESGILLYQHVSRFSITQNNISSNKKDGIRLGYGCDYNLIEDNIVVVNGGSGIDLDGDNENCIVRGNLLQKNNIKIEGAFNLTLEGNIVVNTTDFRAIEFYNFEHQGFDNNEHQGEYGRTLLRNNTVLGSTGDGMFIVNYGVIPLSNRLIIEHNFIANISGAGIKIAYRNNSEIYNNTIKHCNDGISIIECKDISISENTLINNYYSGISSEESENISMIMNNFINNTFFGIDLDDNKENIVVHRNNFIQNYLYGGSQCRENIIEKKANFNGNFWDDWAGPDTNYDNQVDFPYGILGDGKNNDNSPLTFPTREQIHSLSRPRILKPSNRIIESKTTNVTIQWVPVVDYWNHSVSYSIYYKIHEEWILLKENFVSTSYNWYPTDIPVGPYHVKIVATCIDGHTSEYRTDLQPPIRLPTTEVHDDSWRFKTTSRINGFLIPLVLNSLILLIIQRKRRH